MLHEEENIIVYKYTQNIFPRVKPQEMQGKTDWDKANKQLEEYRERKLPANEMFRFYVHKSAEKRFETHGNITFVRCPINMNQEEANKIHNKDCPKAMQDRISNVYFFMTQDEALSLRNLIPTRFDAIEVKNIFKLECLNPRRPKQESH